MMVSPFTFYRGAAKIMAADLKDTPRAGLTAQLCGDAHLSNFGVFASPERNLLFDLNDFDETLPGPFEYDVQRMSASFTIAARNNGFTKAEARDATLASVNAYRTAMAEFAEMGQMDIWYAHLSEQQLMAAIESFATQQERDKKQKKASKEGVKAAKKAAQKARTRDSLQALSKLGELVDGRYRIVSQPPIVVPARDFQRPTASRSMSCNRRSMSSSAHTGPRSKTIGATCWSVSRSSTWRARSWASAASVRGRSSSCSKVATSSDPLFLQVKEATASVLEDHLPKSRYKQHGERVVQGQRMMQAVSDIYLGWTKGCRTTATSTGASCVT